MPSIVVTLNGVESKFDIGKLERFKLYGKRQRVPLDPAGNPCARAALTADGSLLIRAGMTAQGYFDETDNWVPNDQLISLDVDGNPLTSKESTLGKAQPARKVKATELLDHRIEAIYLLEPTEVDAGLAADLKAGSIFAVPFAYRSGPVEKNAYLVQNENGAFLLVGQPAGGTWCELAVPPPVVTEDEEDSDLDFEMF